MTYEEAINQRDIKHGVTNYLIDKGSYYEYVIIAPEIPNDWIEFHQYFKDDFSLYKDELAKKYSTNQSFILRYQVLTNPNQYKDVD